MSDSNALPSGHYLCIRRMRRSTRSAKPVAGKWFEEAFTKLSEADIVFLDPDKGLAPSRCKKHLCSSVKYSFEDEVAADELIAAWGYEIPKRRQRKR